MNLQDNKYNQFFLIREMLETGEIVKHLDLKKILSYEKEVKKERIFFTGEGSSRIFPAKKTMYEAQKKGYKEDFYTDCATQALEYNLLDSTVFVASNSGKTKEDLELIQKLKRQNHGNIISIVANAGTPIMNEAHVSYLLTCGKERAVPATKSVVEQALFYDLLFRKLNNTDLPDFNKLGNLIIQVLQMPIPDEITEALINAKIIYFAGRNNGVAEELTLKANEIARKKSDFLEGTYLFHGIEEVMNKDEVVVIVDPFKDEEEKYKKVLIKGIGLKVVAISTRKTIFPTIIIPEYGDFTNYLEIAAGWNLLVEIGINMGIDMDKTVRARKVGHEF
ncbi:MAG: SIS domain-containing protein [Candidatus Atribacteria bacterium]|nr:SIS domain-containing protein [Candidatus Atribacteria bacterium]